jgi:tetratricopeptide (TPR) repeat protein
LGIDIGITAESLMLRKASHAEACRLFRESLRIKERAATSPSNPNFIVNLVELAQCLGDEKQVGEAMALFDRAVTAKAGPMNLAYALAFRSVLQLHYGDLGAALRDARASATVMEKASGPSDPNLISAWTNLADVLNHADQTAQAQRVSKEGVASAVKADAPGGQVADLQAQQGIALLLEGRPELARRVFEDALRMHEKAKSPADALATTLWGLGTALLDLKKDAEARPALERALAARPEKLPASGELRADIDLAMARLLGAGARACQLAGEAAAIYRDLHNVRRKLREAERWLVRQRCTADG